MAYTPSIRFPKGHCLLPDQYKAEYTNLSASKRCFVPINVDEILKAQVEYATLKLRGTLSGINLDLLTQLVRGHEYVLEALAAHLWAKDGLVRADSLWTQLEPQPIAICQVRADSALARLIFQVGRVVRLQLSQYAIQPIQMPVRLPG